MILDSRIDAEFYSNLVSGVFAALSVCVPPGWGGFTPLHYAALHGNRTLVDLFLSNAADPNLTCDAGQTAFHFACRFVAVAPFEASDLGWIFNVAKLLNPTDKATSSSFTK